MNAMLLPKHKPIRSKRIRESARGRPCTVRGPTCNRNPETTVWAHSPFRIHNNGGMGMKCGDLFGCYSCADCHSWLAGLVNHSGPSESRTLAYHRAQDRSLQMLIEAGIVQVKP